MCAQKAIKKCWVQHVMLVNCIQKLQCVCFSIYDVRGRNALYKLRICVDPQVDKAICVDYDNSYYKAICRINKFKMYRNINKFKILIGSPLTYNQQLEHILKYIVVMWCVQMEKKAFSCGFGLQPSYYPKEERERLKWQQHFRNDQYQWEANDYQGDESRQS